MEHMSVIYPMWTAFRGACKDGTYECDISHVDSPTEWCVGIVVVPKRVVSKDMGGPKTSN